MKTLHLVLKRKWYDKIASGEKTSEYRAWKAYWNKKFTGQETVLVPHRPFRAVAMVYLWLRQATELLFEYMRGKLKETPPPVGTNAIGFEIPGAEENYD